MPDKQLAVVKWSDTEELRIGINEYKGREYFAIRIWFQGSKPGEYFPGKQGLNIPADRTEEVLAAINKAHAASQKKVAAKKKGAR